MALLLPMFATGVRAGCEMPYFPAPVLYPAGPAPYTVEIANINRDAWPDLVVGHRDVNFREMGLSILFGKPGGTLSDPVIDPAAGTISSIAVADFDRDGDDDVVTADYIGRRIRVMNNQSNHLAVIESFEIPQNNAKVLSGDFDGDLNLDFVVTGAHGTSFEVRWGSGDGTFVPASINLAGGTLMAEGLSLDVNGDSLDDLVLLEMSRNVRIVHGSMDRNLKASTVYQAAHRPLSIHAGDIDGNGETELLIAFEEARLQIMWNVGRGNPASSTTVPFQYSHGFSPRSLADLDGDGADELVVLHISAAGVFKWVNGQFAQTHEHLITGRNPTSARFTDLDLNGSLDLIAAGMRGVSITRTTRTGRLQSPESVLRGAFADSVMDFNLDGRDDLLVGGEISRSTGNLLFEESPLGPLSGMPHAVGMLNGDPYPDFVYVGRSYNSEPLTLSIGLSRGDDRWDVTTTTVPGYRATMNPTPAIADFNGDGHGDFAAVLRDGQERSRVVIFYGDSTGSLHQTFVPQYPIGTSRIVSGDFDGDGWADLIVERAGLEEQPGLYVSYSDGKGSLSPLMKITDTAHSGPLAASDVDHDGSDDLIAAKPDWNNTFLSVRLGRRSRGFGPEQSFSSDLTYTSTLQIRDLNGDGFPDAVLGQSPNTEERSAPISILIGSGTGAFGKLTRLEGTGAVWVGEFGGDGVADLLDGGFLRPGHCESRRRGTLRP